MKTRTHPLGARLAALLTALLMAAALLPWSVRSAAAGPLTPEEDETEIQYAQSGGQDGWAHDGEDIYYYRDGEKLRMCFELLPAEESGDMKWYLFLFDGTLFKAEEGRHTTELLMEDTDVFQYCGTGEYGLVNGRIEDGGKFYFYDPQLVTSDIRPVYDEQTDTDKWYFFGEDGAQVTLPAGRNELEHRDDQTGMHTDTVYVSEDGSLYCGELTQDGRIYYFDPFLRIGVYSVWNDGAETLYVTDQDGARLPLTPGWHEVTYTDEWDDEFTDRYYVDESGSAVNGWLTLDGKTYYLDPWLRTWQFSVWDEETDTETWYVTDEDGALLDMSPGWHEISRTDEWDNEFTDRYYVNESGSVVNGWLTLDGKTYYLDPWLCTGDFGIWDDETQTDVWYLADENGVLQSTPAGWSDYTVYDEWDGQEHTLRYYSNGDGTIAFGFFTLEDKTYYLDPWLCTGSFSVWNDETQTETWYITDENGVLLDMAPGWHELTRVDEWDGQERTDRYYVTQEGSIYQGRLELDDKTYYLDPWLRTGNFPVWDNETQTETWYIADESGVLLTPPAGWSDYTYYDEWAQEERSSRFYSNGDGTVVFGFLTLEDKTYYLDPRLCTGSFAAWSDEAQAVLWYVTDENGVLLDMTPGWHAVIRVDEWDGREYTDRYYVSQDSGAYRGRLELDGKTYYLDPWLRTGTFCVWDNATQTETWYVTDENGALLDMSPGWHEISRTDEWDNEFTDRYYVDESGSVVNGWLTLDGKTYYLDPWLRTGDFSIRDEETDDERWYLADDDGVVFDLTPGWNYGVVYTDHWDGVERQHTLYANEDGSLHRGWLTLDGKAYFFNPQLMTGDFSVRDEETGTERWYLADDDGVVFDLTPGWNYGVVYTDRWDGVERQHALYANEDGSLHRGWLTLDGKTYYLDPQLMTGDFSVWEEETGTERWYLADDDGVVFDLIPGWNTGIVFADHWDGVEREHTLYAYEDGSLHRGWLTLDGKTYYCDPALTTGPFPVWDEEADADVWYYAGEDGAVLRPTPGWHDDLAGWDDPEQNRPLYFNDDGTVRFGWFEDGGKTYYCDPYSGSGFRPVYSDGQPEPAWYFFDEDGALVFAGVAKLTDVSMTLSEGFALNFYAAVLEAEGVYAEFTVGGGAPFAVREFTVGEDGVLRFTCPISAKELSQTVTAVLKAPDGTVLDSAAISGAAYLAELTEAAGYSAETAALAQALLAYGRAAEAYFLSGQPVTTGAVDVQSIPTWFRPEDSVLSDGGVAYYGRSLLTQDVTLLRLYFRAGQSFTVRAAGLELTARPNAAEGFYTVDIPVLPGALSQGYQITVDGTAIRFSVGVNDYITTVLQESDGKPALAELCKALYRCGAAAAALPQG